MNTMYQNALQSLYSGCVLPVDREILSLSPLPESVVDPFAAQDCDPIQIMRMTHNALTSWIEEAKKTNYFSKRFVQLSKLVMNGVTTMGRGLVSLHIRGEDLNLAPMSINDLIHVASYHFRKSYQGVIQTVRSHPEISERLLVNQLDWSGMLLRLYKTRDRLNEKPARKQSPEELSGEPVQDGASCRLPETGPKKADLSDGGSLPDISALFEPAALTAPRSFSALGGGKNNSGASREKSSALAPAEPHAHSHSTQTAEQPSAEPAQQPAAAHEGQSPLQPLTTPQEESAGGAESREHVTEESEQQNSPELTKRIASEVPDPYRESFTRYMQQRRATELQANPSRGSP